MAHPGDARRHGRFRSEIPTPRAGKASLRRSVGGSRGPHYVTPGGSWRLRDVFPSVARAARSEGFLRETAPAFARLLVVFLDATKIASSPRASKIKSRASLIEM